MKKVSTLDNFNKFSYGRATGNSTRLIDHAIQLLFDGNIVIVEDAWENGTHEKANKDLFYRIIKRMNFEHSNIKMIINRKELSLKII